MQCTFMAMGYLHTGKHCCLWCNISNDEMAQPLLDRGRSQPRTLEGLQADHNSFQAGGGCLRNAKLHHNVIAPHFFDVPISQVRAKWNNNYICTELLDAWYIPTYSLHYVIHYTGGNAMLAH